MELNKINQSKTEPSINNSQDYELKPYALDQVYKNQLTELRDLILKTAQPKDIELCHKWIKVFNRISKTEKMARNCLCTLMMEQIKDNCYLQYPFTNLRNCDRNLEYVLRELDDQFSGSLSNRSLPSGYENSINPHGFITEITSDQQPDSTAIIEENQNVELRTAAIELTRELQSLRIQLTEKQIENVKLKELAEKFRTEKETHEEMLDNLKKSILESIREILLNMEQRDMIKTQFKLFQYIFAQFSTDKEFTDILSKYDVDLQYVLNRQLKFYFDKQKSIIARHICRKFVKSKTKLREKFKNRLTMQTESYKLQLKLAKLNAFSVLRQIFINHHDEFHRLEGWEVLKALEDKYQRIVKCDL